MFNLIASILLFASALDCEVGKLWLFTTPAGSQTNGVLNARDVPGALAYTNSTKRFTGGVCAATYGLREAQVMRKIFPLACGTIAQWDKLQDLMPDLRAFDLCPTNTPSEEYEDPLYRYRVTAGGERAISLEKAGEGSIWNGNGGTWTDTNRVAKTGDFDLATPPVSNRVFRTPRITNYLKAVIDMPINALLNSKSLKMGNYGHYENGGWLDPTVDHASLVTGQWCVDTNVGIVSDYAAFLRGLSEYRNDANATNMTAGCWMFGGKAMWDWAISWATDYTLKKSGFSRATDKFEEAKAEREGGRITDMIAKAAPGLRASVTGDWQKAVQKMAKSGTTRLWWQRQALANGITALQSKLFMPLGCGFSGLRPKDVVTDSTLLFSRLSILHGKEKYISGTVGKSEYYEIPTGAITPYWGWFDGVRQKGLMAMVDSSKLVTTNTVETDGTTIETLETDGNARHYAYWEQTGRKVAAGLYASRDICGEEDRKYCLPNAGEEPGGGGPGPAVITFMHLEPGEEYSLHIGEFDLVVEAAPTTGPDGEESKEWVFSVYTSNSFGPSLANQFVQRFNVPLDKWTGHGVAAFTANVEGRAYESSDPPGSWLPLPQEKALDGKTSDPIGLVKEGSPLAEMMTADMLVTESAYAGTNNYSGSCNFIDWATNDLKNAWIYSRLSAPFRNVVPTTGALKDLEHWAMGAGPVRERMKELIDTLPESTADKDPFALDNARTTAAGYLKPEVIEMFPKTRELAGPREMRLAWANPEAWSYVLKCSETGIYSAEWRVESENATVVTIECGGTESVAKPTRHSVWVEYWSYAGMILNFSFPMMNSNSEF